MRRLRFLCFMVLLAACTNKKEQPPVPPEKVEQIVLDLELAAAYSLLAPPGNTDTAAAQYRTLVFRHHQTTEADFNEVMKWYVNHPAVLDSVYTHVKSKLEELENKGRMKN